jgi:hypothetical protein
MITMKSPDMSKIHKEKYHDPNKNCTESARLTKMIYENFQTIKKTRTEYSKQLLAQAGKDEYVKIPRLLHACIKLELTEKELFAMEFVISMQVMALPISFNTLRWPEFTTVE